MQTLRKWAACLLVAGICLPALARASEVSDLRAELADMKAKMAAMESAMAMAPGGSGAGGEAANLDSMKKKGVITIGGDVAVDCFFRARDDWTSDHDSVDSTEFHTNSANLRFKVAASPTSYLYIKLDLDDAWYDDRLDGDADQDDLLEECKYVWNNIRSSNWGVVFGKGEVPYGQDKTLGIIQSYNHNHSSFMNYNSYTSEGPVFLLAPVEESFDAQESDANNPHTWQGNTGHPGEVDNVFLFQANYTWKNVVQAQLCVFQNADYNGMFGDGSGSLTRGMHEDRPDDNLLFQSYAARVWFLPTDNLTLELSFINMHLDSRGDTETFGQLSSKDQYAMSFGFDYKAKSAPIDVFGEFQHGWDWNYVEDYHVDILQFGFMWGLTNAIDMGMMYEWLNIQHEIDNNNEEEYSKFVVSGQYTFESGIKCILEYGYERYNGQAAGGGDDDRAAHLIGFRTTWAF